MKELVKKIVSGVLVGVMLISLIACQDNKKNTADLTTSESTTQVTTQTTTQTTTEKKEMVTLLSRCPTYEEYISKLKEQGFYVEVDKEKEASDGKRMIASVTCEGYSLTIDYLKQEPHSILSIWASKTTTSYNENWMSTTAISLFKLLYFYLDDVPNSVSSDTLTKRLTDKDSIKRSSSEYTFTNSCDYELSGIKYGLSVMGPSYNSTIKIGSVMVTAEIDEDYMVEKK